MKKILGGFLAVLFLVIAGYIGVNFWLGVQIPVIIKPLPRINPVKEAAQLLHDKKIAVDTQDPPFASESAILVHLSSSNTRVIFSVNKDLPTQVGSLQIILNKLTIEGRKGTKIDLRFDNPVVVY